LLAQCLRTGASPKDFLLGVENNIDWVLEAFGEDQFPHEDRECHAELREPALYRHESDQARYKHKNGAEDAPPQKAAPTTNIAPACSACEL
jgi:hypothetical protein